MIDTIPTSTPQAQPLREELAQLFALPFIAGKSVTREGTLTRLVVTSHRRTDRTRVDLLVSLFLRNLPLPSEEDRDVDQAALDAFLEGLNDPDPNLRVGACEALGQLGHPAARSALEAAAQDADQSVCVAAEQALRVLTAPRVRRDALHGLHLRFWQPFRHLRVPLREEWTDGHGQAWFANLVANAVYRCQ